MRKKNFLFWAIVIQVYVFIMMYFTVSTLGPENMNLLLPALQEKFGWTPGQIMPRIAIINILGIFTGFIISSLMMKVSIRVVTVICMVINGALFIAQGNIQNLDQFVWVIIIMTFVSPATWIAQGAIIANWFFRTRGKVMGIVTIAFPLSTATFVPIGTKILASVGYTAFYSGVGIIIIGLGVIGIFAMRDRPEEIGLEPDGIPFTEEEKAKIKELEAYKSSWKIKKILMTKELWIFGFAWGMLGFIMMTMLTQFIPVLVSKGIHIDTALVMMSVAALLGMPISYLWGYMNDKIGAPKACVVFSLTYIIGAIGFIFGSGSNMTVAYLVILGTAFATGGMPNLRPALLAYIVGRKDYLHINRYVSILTSVCGSLGIALVGIMYDAFQSYVPLFYIDIALAIVAAFLFLFMNKTFDPERIEFQNEKKVA